MTEIYDPGETFTYENRAYKIMAKFTKRGFVAFTIEDRKHVLLSSPHRDKHLAMLGGYARVKELKALTGK